VRITRIASAVAATIAATVGTALLAGCDSGSTATPAATTPATSTAATTTGAAGPAGNGIAELPLPQVLTRVRTALGHASSVRVRTDLGTGKDRLVIDARIKGNQGATGTMLFGTAPMGFLRLGAKTMYLHGNAAAWRAAGADPASLSVLAGKWVLVPVASADKDFAALVEFTSVGGLAAQLTDFPNPPKIAISWPKASVRGLPAIRIGDLATGALFVAASGQPYPLRLQSTAGTDKGVIDLLEFNAPVTLTTPPASQILTLPGS
jgi:hypothetical protein